MAEHYYGIVGVTGSNPVRSTKFDLTKSGNSKIHTSLDFGGAKRILGSLMKISGTIYADLQQCINKIL